MPPADIPVLHELDDPSYGTYMDTPKRMKVMDNVTIDRTQQVRECETEVQDVNESLIGA